MLDLKSIVNKAQTDPSFRARLTTDPAQALQETAVDLPAGSVLAVIDPRPNELHLFLSGRNQGAQIDPVLQRARTDPAFKAKLLNNPKATLEETLGEKLPAASTVCVHEPASNTVYLVLPPARNESGELSDLELDAVAGAGLWKNMLNALCSDTRTPGVSQQYDDNNSVRIDTIHRSGTVDYEKVWS